MFKPLLLAAAATLLITSAQAQAPTPASGAKKELIAKLLTLMQPAVENMAQQLAQQPAVQIQQGAGQALQRVPAERREAVARDIEADLRKYVDEAVPLVRAKAVKLAPGTIGALLDERFSEGELREIAALLESPANRKFQQAFPEMQKALGEKLVAESKVEIEPKVRALDQTVARRLGITPSNSAASAPKSAATPAKKP